MLGPHDGIMCLFAKAGNFLLVHSGIHAIRFLMNLWMMNEFLQRQREAVARFSYCENIIYLKKKGFLESIT